MTTHNQFPLLPGSRKCSSVLSAGRKPQKQMKEGGHLLCCCYHWSQWVGQEGRHRGDRGSSKEQNTWDKRAGLGSTWGRGGMARGEKSGLERELSLAEGRRVEQGRASYLDRVLSAKCFCWLSACLVRSSMSTSMASCSMCSSSRISSNCTSSSFRLSIWECRSLTIT